jgi:hypothetical protein
MPKKEIKEPVEKKSFLTKIGPFAFMIGLVIAVVTAVLMPSNEIKSAFIWGLGLLGLFVGLVNISEKEMTSFLLATIAFIVASSGLIAVFEPFPALAKAVTPLMRNIVIFVAPGAAIVALKALYSISKD